MYCPECGYDNPDNARFCIGCRYEYERKKEPTPLPPQPQPQLRPQSQPQSQLETVRSETKTAKWECAICSELVDDVLAVCWNCQSARTQDCRVAYEDGARGEGELRAEEMRGPSAHPLRGCIRDVCVILICMVLMAIAVSAGYRLLGYVILFGGGGVFAASAARNFWAIPGWQKVLSLGTVIGLFSILYFLLEIVLPRIVNGSQFGSVWVSFFGCGIAAVLWWLGFGMARKQQEKTDE